MHLHAEMAPQWSPPLVGGMTPHREHFLVLVPRAAMEPAAGGRDDRLGPDHGEPAPDRAAMEPAAGGRDDAGVLQDLLAPRGLAAMEPAAGGRDDRPRWRRR